MAIAKQIGTMNKTRLSNAAHKNMNTEIYDRILAATTAALHLEDLAPGYKECIDREGECVNRITKSATTSQLVAKDGERDKSIRFIYSMNGSYQDCPDPALQSAAEVVDAVLGAYDKLYARAYAEETALIDGLLHDLAAPAVAAALKALGLETYVTRLKTLNDEYKELDASRTDEYTARVKTDTAKARKATDETLELIIQRVNAYAVLKPTEVIDSFIDTVNQIFRKYKDLIAAKGGPSSSSKPDDKPYPAPDPVPDPDPTPDPEPEPDPDSGNNDRPVIE